VGLKLIKTQMISKN